MGKKQLVNRTALRPEWGSVFGEQSRGESRISRIPCLPDPAPQRVRNLIRQVHCSICFRRPASRRCLDRSSILPGWSRGWSRQS